MLSVGKLITEVEKESCIWNPKHKDYGDKQIKTEAWEKICKVFYPQPEDHTGEDSKQKITFLQKKWKSIRDYYVKQRKDMLNNSSPSEAKRKKYLYFDQLRFLDAGSQRRSPRPDDAISCKTEPDELEEEIWQNEESEDTIKTEEPEEEDPIAPERRDIDEDEMFLMSLLPSIRKLSPLQKIDFKLEVMGSLKRIQFS